MRHNKFEVLSSTVRAKSYLFLASLHCTREREREKGGRIVSQ